MTIGRKQYPKDRFGVIGTYPDYRRKMAFYEYRDYIMKPHTDEGHPENSDALPSDPYLRTATIYINQDQIDNAIAVLQRGVWVARNAPDIKQEDRIERVRTLKEMLLKASVVKTYE